MSCIVCFNDHDLNKFLVICPLPFLQDTISDTPLEARLTVDALIEPSAPNTNDITIVSADISVAYLKSVYLIAYARSTNQSAYCCNTSSVPSWKASIPIFLIALHVLILVTPVPEPFKPNTSLSSVDVPNTLLRPRCTRYSASAFAAALVTIAHVGTEAYAGLLAYSFKFSVAIYA